MKARICDICKTTISLDKGLMLYSVMIASADGYEADTAAEKKLLLDLEDMCSGCTARVKAAIEFIRKGKRK